MVDSLLFGLLGFLRFGRGAQNARAFYDDRLARYILVRSGGCGGCRNHFLHDIHARGYAAEHRVAITFLVSRLEIEKIVFADIDEKLRRR